MSCTINTNKYLTKGCLLFMGSQILCINLFKPYNYYTYALLHVYSGWENHHMPVH